MEVGGRRVEIDSSLPSKQAERNQSVEEVACASRVQIETLLQRLSVEWSDGKLGEEIELDSAQQCLRSPEGDTQLHDVLGRNLGKLLRAHHRVAFDVRQ